MLFLRDASFEREEANPLDAVLVFLTNPFAELDADVRMALTGRPAVCAQHHLIALPGSVVTWVSICSDFFGKSATIVKFDSLKFAVHASGPYILVHGALAIPYCSLVTRR